MTIYLTCALNRHFLAALWPGEWVGAESVARYARSDEDAILLARESQPELPRISRVDAISSISSSACAIVVVAWSSDARGGDVAKIEELSEISKKCRVLQRKHLQRWGYMSGRLMGHVSNGR